MAWPGDGYVQHVRGCRHQGDVYGPPSSGADAGLVGGPVQPGVCEGGKKNKPSATATSSGELRGREVRAEDGDLMKFVENYSLHPGWHHVSGVGILVATDATPSAQNEA